MPQRSFFSSYRQKKCSFNLFSSRHFNSQMRKKRTGSTQISVFCVFLSPMGRIVAIDYGQKRCGVAATDILGMIPGGLGTVSSGDLMKFLKDYIAKEPVDLFVMGLPKRMNNEPSESMKFIEAFVQKLKVEIPQIPVEFVDERFTSKIAQQAMLAGGLKKKDRQKKELVDEISAVIILQSYLESKSFIR